MPNNGLRCPKRCQLLQEESNNAVPDTGPRVRAGVGQYAPSPQAHPLLTPGSYLAREQERDKDWDWGQA
jgi:hypothetical protein